MGVVEQGESSDKISFLVRFSGTWIAITSDFLDQIHFKHGFQFTMANKRDFREHLNETQ